MFTNPFPTIDQVEFLQEIETIKRDFGSFNKYLNICSLPNSYIGVNSDPIVCGVFNAYKYTAICLVACMDHAVKYNKPEHLLSLATHLHNWLLANGDVTQ